MAFHMCFYVSEKPTKPNHMCFHMPERPQRAWQGLGKVWQGCRWSPGGPKRPQEAPGNRFIRAFTCLSGAPWGLRASARIEGTEDLRPEGEVAEGEAPRI